MNKRHRGQSVIGLLIALVIIIGMFLMIAKNYKPAAQDSFTKDAGVNTSSYKTIIDSARRVAADAAKPKQEIP